MTALTALKVKGFTLDQTLESAFPAVNPGEKPLGSLVLLQIKQPPSKTASGIILTESDMQTEMGNTRVAKVIALGDLAYKSRETMQPWPEGAWVKPGDYVRVSQHNCKLWSVPIPGTHGKGSDEKVLFGLIDDLHISSLVQDPLAVQAFF